MPQRRLNRPLFARETLVDDHLASRVARVRERRSLHESKPHEPEEFRRYVIGGDERRGAGGRIRVALDLERADLKVAPGRRSLSDDEPVDAR